jgi:hypothetical protein
MTLYEALSFIVAVCGFAVSCVGLGIMLADVVNRKK